MPEPAPRVALVVEDDEHIGLLLKFILQRSGFLVTLAGDGHAARDFILQSPAPAVVLLDVMLPFMDGVQLASLARQQAGWAQVPILMLTAKSQQRDIARALEAGASDYIVKPFLPDELLARVRRLAAPS